MNIVSTEIEINIANLAKNLKYDSFISVHMGALEGKVPRQQVMSSVSPELANAVGGFLDSRKFEFKVGTAISFDIGIGQRYSIQLLDKDAGMFEWLTIARQNLGQAFTEVKASQLVLDLRNCGPCADKIADAYVSAMCAAMYKFPKYETPKATKEKEKSSKTKDHPSLKQITILADKTQSKKVEVAAKRALNLTSSGTNLVRWLAKRAGNDLTCKSYISYLKSLSAQRKWKFEHIDHSKLTTLKAGGFLAVVQGSGHQDYGIVKLTYTPPTAKKHLKKHLVLVGKGLVFDTGGHNIKTSHMLGMHGDMAGSAVAASLLNVATLEKWPIKITAFLAIADNMVGPRSYKPNDVITTMNGTTIEVIDTDAEGRMVLSDTLTLASKEKPDLMMDFATLTGACVRAIGTTFSGVFSNRKVFSQSLIESGYESGERVWPFPMDKDFSDCLESTSADTKQCREKGGVDHIEASQFLMRFVEKDVPWVHVDLSAIENPGGLAHVPTDETGFGVRFAAEFAQKVLKF